MAEWDDPAWLRSSPCQNICASLSTTDWSSRSWTPWPGADDVRAELGLSSDAVFASAVGRINPDKRFDFYVEAAHKVSAQHAHTHFLVIGGDEVVSHPQALRRARDLFAKAR